MTLSFTAKSGKWRRVSGAKVQQIIDMDKEKGIYLSKNPFFLSILAFLKKHFFSRVPPWRVTTTSSSLSLISYFLASLR